MKVLSVVITYNATQKNWIDNCVSSLNKSTIPLDILLVDNNSADNTVGYVKEKYPDVILIENKKNIGFGAANNLGFDFAIKNNYDYILLVNQDLYIDKNTLRNLIEISELNKEYYVLSPIHLNGNGKTLDRNFSNYINYDANKYFLRDVLFRKEKSVYSVPFVNAACWLMPIDTLKKIGFFDELFEHYGEDNNYCQRVLFHGGKIGVVTETYCFHDREEVIRVTSDLKQFQLRVLNILADLNNSNFREDYRTYKIGLLKSVFRNLLFLKFKVVSLEIKKFAFLKGSIKSIIESRIINS